MIKALTVMEILFLSLRRRNVAVSDVILVEHTMALTFMEVSFSGLRRPNQSLDSCEGIVLELAPAYQWYIKT